MSSVIATLLDVQFSVRGPLLRTTALTGLPVPVRRAMIDRSDRIARRYAGMLSDGAAEGSIRPVDALIVSQSLMALAEIGAVVSTTRVGCTGTGLARV